MRRLARFPALLAVLAVARDTSTEPRDAADASTPAGVRVFATPSPPSLSIRVGERMQLRAEVNDRNGALIPDAEVEWISSAPATAFVDDAGSLLAVARGMTMVTA